MSGHNLESYARYRFRLWPMFARELELHGLMKIYQTEKSVATLCGGIVCAPANVRKSSLNFPS